MVRLRDGSSVPHFPSYVHRLGRSFGRICETLEGALPLLITGALAPHSPEAEWILNDYEDNLYLSNQYGYTLDNFDQYWFGRGGMSMQAGSRPEKLAALNARQLISARPACSIVQATTK